MLNAVELFAGAGGLAMGVSLARFKPLAVLEWDRWACDTLQQNKERGFPLLSEWPIHCGDVCAFDYGSITGPVALVSGGPPCQPFSMGGKHRAYDDHRDMFPATVDGNGSIVEVDEVFIGKLKGVEEMSIPAIGI